MRKKVCGNILINARVWRYNSNNFHHAVNHFVAPFYIATVTIIVVAGILVPISAVE